MTYGQYIEQYITQQPLAAPIYTADISRILADAFQMKPDKASSTTAVAMKRLMDRRTIPALRFYQNGIYLQNQYVLLASGRIDFEDAVAAMRSIQQHLQTCSAWIEYQIPIKIQLAIAQREADKHNAEQPSTCGKGTSVPDL